MGIASAFSDFLSGFARKLEFAREKRNYLFRGLGLPFLPTDAPRVLISYTPWFIRRICRFTEIGLTGWEPGNISQKLQPLLKDWATHTNHWESAELVRQCIERGYIVDLVSENHGHLIEDASGYFAIIDGWDNLPRWAAQNPEAQKVFYSTTSHWASLNSAELLRHKWILRRHGIDVPTERQIPPLLGGDCADEIWSFGNSHVFDTFGPLSAKIKQMKLSAVESDIKPYGRNWSECRKSFVYFGSTGWVHRGLDLLIEAFEKMPELALNIVGPLPESPDSEFYRIYGDTLKSAPNIRLRGFMDPLSKEFHQIMAKSACVVYPSASEACSGAIVQCMHHGVIPLATPIVGPTVTDLADNMEFPTLQADSDYEFIDLIRRRCIEISNFDESRLAGLSEYCHKYANANHTRKTYSESIARLLDNLLPKRN